MLGICGGKTGRQAIIFRSAPAVLRLGLAYSLRMLGGSGLCFRSGFGLVLVSCCRRPSSDADGARGQAARAGSWRLSSCSASAPALLLLPMCFRGAAAGLGFIRRSVPAPAAAAPYIRENSRAPGIFGKTGKIKSRRALCLAACIYISPLSLLDRTMSISRPCSGVRYFFSISAESCDFGP